LRVLGLSPSHAYVPTWAGFFMTPLVLDRSSRRIVGWSMASTLAAQPVLDGPNATLLARRRPEGIGGLSSRWERSSWGCGRDEGHRAARN